MSCCCGLVCRNCCLEAISAYQQNGLNVSAEILTHTCSNQAGKFYVWPQFWPSSTQSLATKIRETPNKWVIKHERWRCISVRMEGMAVNTAVQFTATQTASYRVGDIKVRVIRPVTRGASTPCKIFRPPWKNVLDIVQKIRAPLRKLFASLVSQAGYGPASHPRRQRKIFKEMTGSKMSDSNFDF